jgi:pimeloyl-ACP methyl ester carboxylesterase
VGLRNKATIETQFRMIDGLSIRFAESESRGDDALLLCPWPEALFAFDQMWERLAGQAHLVAIDLPGFGHSERRDALLSPRTMGEFVARAADAFGLEEPHVVGPDIGTGALLFVAAQQPKRWRSLSSAVGQRRTLSSWVVRLPNGSGRGTSKSSRRLTRANSWQACSLRWNGTGFPRPSERTTSQPTREIDSWGLCGSYALTLETWRFCAICYPRWRRRCRSSLVGTTPLCQGPTQSFSTSGYRTASWT